MSIRRIQHVSVPRPGGEEAHRKAVAFYEGIMGAKHVPSPDSLSALDLTWFRWGDDEIHIYATGPGEPSPHHGGHFCMAIEDIEDARGRLREAGIPCHDTTPIPGRPRFFTNDPFGNSIEISQIDEDGSEAR